MGNDTAKTDGDVKIQDVAIYPLVDAHMHIQSNNIAPIPIMIGVVRGRVPPSSEKLLLIKENPVKISFLGGEEKKDSILNKAYAGQGFAHGAWVPKGRKVLNFATDNIISKFFVKEYGKVTKYNSYYIAEFYRNELSDVKLGVSSRTVKANGKTIAGITIKAAKFKLANMNESRKFTVNIFKNVSAHYYVYTGSNERWENGPKISAVFDFSIVMGMELMYAHYWGAYGIPIYIPIKGKKNKLYYLTNDISITRGEGDREQEYFFNQIYDIDVYDKHDEPIDFASYVNYNNKKLSFNDHTAEMKRIEKLYKMKYIEAEELKKGKEEGPKYSHFLKKVNDSEMHEFEDHIKHLLFTQMAVLKYPFKYLPFYHFDPRRFFPDSTKEELSKYHNFYINSGTGVKKIETSEIAKSINSTDVFKYKMSYENLENKFIVVGTVQKTVNKKQEPNRQEPDKDENTIADGLFWGVKMYVALGYPPYMSISDEARNIFPCLGNSYNELKDFYIFCAKNDIPITCHGSPQGMTIADPEVYLKEYLKRDEASAYAKESFSHFCTGRNDFAYGLGLIDDFSSPNSWEKVLDTLGDSVNDLRLCLAHFGGKGFFTGKYEEASFYCWFNKIVEMINNKEYKIYTDISCFVFPNFVEFPPDLSQELYNKIIKTHAVIRKIYTEFQSKENAHLLKTDYFKSLTAEERSQAVKLRLDIIDIHCKKTIYYKDLNKTVEKLVELLDNDSEKKLRYRIMFGTDWPMTETNVMGVPKYNSAIFVLLQLVTRKLKNEKKFDAWHQFAVINPLRFLGVLRDKDDKDVNDEDDEFKVSMKKFKEMKKALLKLNKNVLAENGPYDENIKEIFVLDKENDVEEDIDNAFELLKERMENLKIPAAHLVKSGDKFLLIGE
jgi:hypothetical protein